MSHVSSRPHSTSVPSPHTDMAATSFGPQDTAYEFLTELVHKRIATINYLRRAHEGSTHWFNTVLLGREDLTKMYQNAKMRKRTHNFYILGTSLAPILDVSNPPDYVKALSLLLQEFEYHTSDHSKPKMVGAHCYDMPSLFQYVH
ncbi:hypothetical protein BC938DRAFT_476167 [Jimgerdemannia flammicorona]|uniref:Uncharacterized protein n=1 Tax=Jimgerdemannia flammicorona TaxID=994334 RepID=A0A433QQW5_9FUNG|nr:hypothetical protein BC938DRAFT_476167 [Jimgerdemannia flammicorona]